MPKFARPTSYNGRQATQQWTGDGRFATLEEAIAGVSTSTMISPATMQVGTLSSLSVEGGAPILPAAGNFDFSGGSSDIVFSSPGPGLIELNIAGSVSGTVTTNDGTGQTKTLITFPMPTPNCAASFDFLIVGYNVTDGEAVGYTLVGTAVSAGAVALVVPTPDKFSNEQMGSIIADVSLTAAANNVLLRVQGIPTKVINWSATGRTVAVS